MMVAVVKLTLCGLLLLKKMMTMVVLQLLQERLCVEDEPNPTPNGPSTHKDPVLPSQMDVVEWMSYSRATIEYNPSFEASLKHSHEQCVATQWKVALKRTAA